MEADNASLILNNYLCHPSVFAQFLREEIGLSFGQIMSLFVFYFTQFCTHCDQKARTVVIDLDHILGRLTY